MQEYMSGLGLPAVLLILLLCGAVSADDGSGEEKASISSLTTGQKVQLEVDALKTLNSVIGKVAEEAKRRGDLLDKYLKETSQVEAYHKARQQMAERAPKASDWIDGEKSDEDVPLDFDDAVTITVECELEERGQEISKAEPEDLEGLRKAAKAHRELAKKRFGETIAQMIEVDRQIDFIRDQGQWEKAVAWAKNEVERQGVERAKQREADQAARKAEKEKKREEQLARVERARQRRIEDVQRRWQRRAEAYQLQTQRIRAKIGPSYPRRWYYPHGDCWWQDVPVAMPH